MILTRFRALGLLGLQDVDLAFQNPVTVVTGGPASGKTTLLLSLVAAVEQLAPSGAQAIELFSDPPGTGVKLGLSFDVDGFAVDAEVIADSPLNAEVKNPRGVASVFAWNHGRRLVLLHEHRHIDASPGAPSTATLREPTSRKHAGLVQFMAEHAADGDFVERLGLGLSAACPELRLSPAKRPGEPPRFSRGGVEVPFAALSDAERAALVLSAEILRSGMGQSLVLVDTIERSISPAAAAALVAALPRLSPQAQFIVTTRIENLEGAHQRVHLTLPRRSS
jgi:hypothetical protein